MKLVLLGEGHGEASALPILARKLLREKDPESRLLYVDSDIIRTRNPSGFVLWNKERRQPDYGKWIRYLQIARRRGDVGAVLAIYDGDAPTFPAGSSAEFCAKIAARMLTAAAAEAGAGKMFSLAVVFACIEYESWLVAGAESLAGKCFPDGRLALPADMEYPEGDPEGHGKRWLETHCSGYRPTRDQGPLTDLLDLPTVRAKKLRSFSRLDHALDQLLEAVRTAFHVATPREGV
jgi:hypothetical protein